MFVCFGCLLKAPFVRQRTGEAPGEGEEGEGPR